MMNLSELSEPLLLIDRELAGFAIFSNQEYLNS